MPTPEQVLEWLRTALASVEASELADRTTATFLTLQTVTQWAAILLAALAGVYESRRRDFSFIGVLIIAFVASLGGGTLRDILLARYPLFWVSSPVYLVSVIAVALLGIFVMVQDERANQRLKPLLSPVQQVMRTDQLPTWVILVDALGLGLFAFVGTSFALQVGCAPLVAPVFGVITAAFGGVLRDVLFAETPTILKRGQLYATSAAIGSVLYVVLNTLGIDMTWIFIVCVGSAFVSRVASVHFNIRG